MTQRTYSPAHGRVANSAFARKQKSSAPIPLIRPKEIRALKWEWP